MRDEQHIGFDHKKDSVVTDPTGSLVAGFEWLGEPEIIRVFGYRPYFLDNALCSILVKPLQIVERIG